MHPCLFLKPFFPAHSSRSLAFLRTCPRAMKASLNPIQCIHWVYITRLFLHLLLKVRDCVPATVALLLPFPGGYPASLSHITCPAKRTWHWICRGFQNLVGSITGIYCRFKDLLHGQTHKASDAVALASMPRNCSPVVPKASLPRG